MNMRNLFIFLFVMMGAMLITTGCSDDETCTDGIQNQDETGIDCGGVCEACPTCSDGIQNGTETGVDCGGTDCDDCLVGLQATSWLSAGADIAPILAPFAKEIFVDFRADGTYLVVQTDLDDAVINLNGTYVQEESSVDGIWNISLNQTNPSVLTSEGIFMIDGDVMLYEVAQTEPAISGVTPPTAEAGFGSTSGGAFGENNVQTYVKQD